MDQAAMSSLLSSLPREEVLNLVATAEAELAREGKLWTLYPSTGPLRRELYPKHLAFFAAGRTHGRRAFMAANRIGKTFGTLAYETALHLTGMYDEVAPWWRGRVWDRPINALLGGDTNATTRDILVQCLLGGEGERGTGMIPAARIEDIAPAPGLRGHVDYAKIGRSRAQGGGKSILQFRSYDQGREAWQGTARDVLGLDEEPPLDIYVEGATRLLTTQGSMMLTFTPLRGVSDVVMKFMPELTAVAAYKA